MPSPADLPADRPDAATDWRGQELLLMRQVMALVGRSLAPADVFHEMMHLMSELLGLNRGRLVLVDDDPAPDGTRQAAIRHAYGLTAAERARGRYRWGEGVTGRVLSSGLPAIVQDVDAEPLFLFRSVRRAQLPPQTVAFIALPVAVRGATVGVLACHRIRSRQRHLNDDLALLRILATLAGQLLELEQLVAEQTRQLQARNAALERALDSAAARYGLIGRSPPLLQALAELERVSQSQATVLLLGESGSGKELFARAVHLASPRRDQPFIKVNCAAIPESLFESELFGHERGAFTGAAGARAGWFEQAHQGTLFLDEIGELDPRLQAALLRVLQDGVFRRLGGRQDLRFRGRLVAATNADLGARIAAREFREDLYYRLAVVELWVPPLRERPAEVLALAQGFAQQAAQRQGLAAPALAAEAQAALLAHDWPGNVRELRNRVERALALAEGDTLGSADLFPERALDEPAGAPATLASAREQAELAQIERALELSGGRLAEAAQRLGVSRTTLWKRRKKLLGEGARQSG